jgi:diacylglycerol O-acyltransferase
MERLSPLSAAFLSLEDADPTASLAIGSMVVFEGPAPSYEELVSAIQGRLPLVPRYRQRLRTVPFDVAAPGWVDDPHFDLRWHLRHTAVPSPGGPEQVGRLLSRVMMQRMDRSRPLWEAWLCEGLDGGRWGLLSKVHHSVVDGVSGTDLYRLVLDVAPEPAAPVADDWRPQAPPSAVAALAGGVWETLRMPVTDAGVVGGALRSPRALAGRAGRSARGLAALAGSVARPSRSRSLLGPLSGSRRFAWTAVSLSDVDEVRHRFGASVNDVALTVIAGGFRRLLLERGEEPGPHALRSLVPVSVRAPGEESVPDNRVSLLVPYLPVDVADPVERLGQVRSRIRALQAAGEAEAGEAMTSLATLGPFGPLAFGLRQAFHLPQRTLGTVTTNVPGPRTPLYALGRRAEQIIPYVPIADEMRVGVAIFSYCDRLTFGVTADYDSVPDVGELTAGIDEAMTSLREAADGLAADAAEGEVIRP